MTFDLNFGILIYLDSIQVNQVLKFMVTWGKCCYFGYGCRCTLWHDVSIRNHQSFQTAGQDQAVPNT